MAKKNGETNEATKAAKGGRKLGGDDNPTYAWLDGEVRGRVVSVDSVKTKYKPRTRVVIELSAPADLHVTIGKNRAPEEASLGAGDRLGIWLPDRYETALRPLIGGGEVSFDREGQGMATVYDIRDLSS